MDTAEVLDVVARVSAAFEAYELGRVEDLFMGGAVLWQSIGPLGRPTTIAELIAAFNAGVAQRALGPRTYENVRRNPMANGAVQRHTYRGTTPTGRKIEF